MRHSKLTMKQTALGLILSLCHFSAPADSPVWKVHKGDHHLYLGGTIHFLGAADYPLPEKLDFAYRHSDMLVFETDLQSAASQEFQQALLRELSYPNGMSLKDELSPQTFRKLSDYCAAKNIPLQQIVVYKPGLAALVLTITELQRLGIGGVGVDQFYFQRAVAENRPTGYLESTQRQLRFLIEMGGGQADATINYTLRDIAELASTISGIKSAWRIGNLQKLETISLTPLVESFPEVYHSLLVERNEEWMPDLEQMLKDDQIELVLVGALHLVGKDGLLQKFRAKGYVVENL